MTVPDVPNGVYYVRVRGLNGDGPSAPSNEVIAVVPGGGGGSTPPAGCSAPPNPPQNLTGTATGNLVTLNWSAAGGCPATSYAVQAGSGPGLSNITVANVGGATTLSSGAPTGSYYIRVVALNAFGGSTASNETVVTVASACQAPTAAPMLLSPTVVGNSISFNWVAVGAASSYVVEAGSVSGAANLLNTITTGTSHTWSAPVGVSYIRVRPVNNCGTGPASNQITATIATTPLPPTGGSRVGAICRDGWRSTSTGSGTCSSHGGVQCWLYNDGSCRAS